MHLCQVHVWSMNMPCEDGVLVQCQVASSISKEFLEELACALKWLNVQYIGISKYNDSQG